MESPSILPCATCLDRAAVRGRTGCMPERHVYNLLQGAQGSPLKSTGVCISCSLGIGSEATVPQGQHKVTAPLDMAQVRDSNYCFLCKCLSSQDQWHESGTTPAESMELHQHKTGACERRTRPTVLPCQVPLKELTQMILRGWWADWIVAVAGYPVWQLSATWHHQHHSLVTASSTDPQI